MGQLSLPASDLQPMGLSHLRLEPTCVHLGLLFTRIQRQLALELVLQRLMVVVVFGDGKTCLTQDAKVRPLLSLLLPGPPGQLLLSTPLKRLPLQW